MKQGGRNSGSRGHAASRNLSNKRGTSSILERIKKYCSHSIERLEKAVFLFFGFVSAQSQGYSNLLLRRSLAKNQKFSLRIGYSIFLTALENISASAGN
jgi:hypothetical protein